MKSPRTKKLLNEDLDAVARLSAMQYFPPGKQGQKALTDAFATACASKDRVEQAVQHFLDEYDKCPTVHEIKAYCYQNYLHMKDGVSRLKQLKATVKCPKCDGYGRAPAEPLARTEGPFKGQVDAVLTYCDCEIGKELRRVSKKHD